VDKGTRGLGGGGEASWGSGRLQSWALSGGSRGSNLLKEGGRALCDGSRGRDDR
jgi:hypothetical protein